jgi:hypothetical protein
MSSVSPNQADLTAMGIDLSADTGNDLDSGISELDLNDPDVAALLKSFEEQAPTVQELAERVARGDDTPAVETAVTPTEDTAASGTETLLNTTPVEDTPEQNTVADAFLVDLGDGNTAQITQDDAARLIGLDQWARSLPDQTVRAFAAIESGDAIAISRAQYDQFALWAAGQNSQTSQTAAPAPVFDEFTDDTTKALYQQVQQLQQTVQYQQQQQVDQQAAYQVAQMEAYLQQRADVFEGSFNEVAKNYGLTDAESIAALNYAANSRLVQSVNNELTVINPATGAVIRDADPAQVAQVTFERAVMLVPELRQKAIDQQVQARLDAERNAITATNQKKNRAASLSSAPAAATSTSRNVREMSTQEIEAAIAAELRAAIG